MARQNLEPFEAILDFSWSGVWAQSEEGPVNSHNPVLIGNGLWCWGMEQLEGLLSGVTTPLIFASRLGTLARKILETGECSFCRGGALKRGIWVRRIGVTLSIFDFSSWFLAPIVKNCETHLSRAFLGPEEFFRKFMTKTKSAYYNTAGNLDLKNKN